MKELSCKEAQDAFAKDPSIVFVDVRSVPEYSESHPKGALNVPIMNKGPGGMTPNPEFLQVITAAVPKDKKVLVSCLSGGRSARAGMLMEQNGWRDVTNVRGGFGGARDMMGNVTEPGWAAQGLPVEQGDPAGRSYADLKKKA
jgi:rhodanese-related sulfurtransferase